MLFVTGSPAFGAIEFESEPGLTDRKPLILNLPKYCGRHFSELPVNSVKSILADRNCCPGRDWSDAWWLWLPTIADFGDLPGGNPAITCFFWLGNRRIPGPVFRPIETTRAVLDRRKVFRCEVVSRQSFESSPSGFRDRTFPDAGSSCGKRICQSTRRAMEPRTRGR